MLRHLHVRDFAIVDRIDLELESGFTVFTGETGAGKSILVEALGLVLGDRAGADLVRAGCERAVIVAQVDLAAVPQVAAVLAERGLDAGEECLLQRQIGADGRSRAFVNGTPVPVSVLAELAALLVDIHGQHAHQLLLRRPHQRALLDAFGGHAEALATVAELAARWQALDAELAALGSDAADPAAEIERLQYQLGELEELALEPEAIERLEQDHRRAANVTRLAESACAALEAVAEAEGSAGDRLGAAGRVLAEAAAIDARLGTAARLLGEAGIAAAEAAAELRRYLADLEFEPETVAALEERIAVLHALARKHRCRLAELGNLRERLRARLAGLAGLGERTAALEAERAAVHERYRRAAESLHRCRSAAAEALERAAGEALAALGMPGARLHIEVERTAPARPSAHGEDEVTFLVSTNPGQPPRPLAKIASGGELSRISLAIRMVAVSDRDVPTLVFDEVDAGIGGRVAEIVGRELRRLGERRQVLSVTHLPQVASLAHHHLVVEKRVERNTTLARVRRLDRDARTEEIARMLGGMTITEQTLAHAREMLAS